MFKARKEHPNLQLLAVKNLGKENVVNFGTINENFFEYDTFKENSTDHGIQVEISSKDGTTQKDTNIGVINNGTIKKDVIAKDVPISNDINANNAVRVKREIGLFSAVTMTLGVIIGAGIFVSPKGILANSGSVGSSLVVWVTMGLFSMIGAACYIELGTTFPKSGNDFTYIKEIFGNFPAFMYLWVKIICLTPAGMAILSLTFANYILESLTCVPSPMLTRVVAVLPVCE
ncbi:hypothetical protein JTE90_023979 [Oedothorax gibbosus]|uniref:Uncharacterized protein n=1 Tax=Oedothorax gibbosus TaxID=931172 RepID=A0AAV6UFT5_9ARAC|nr:hypothetical protein JTE90_023979 [Oedothorax gibbosus]